MADFQLNNGPGQVARLSAPHMDELMRLAARLPRHGLLRLVERAAFLVEQSTGVPGQVLQFPAPQRAPNQPPQRNTRRPPGRRREMCPP